VNTTIVRLWFLWETDKARCYCRLPSSRIPAWDLFNAEDKLWVPKSIIEHTTKRPPKPGECWPEHEVKLPDWFVEKERL